MKVLITGGAGYIGYSLVRQFEDNPEVEEIFIYDNLTNNPLNFFLGYKKLKKTKLIEADILDTLELNEALKDKDLVIHLAAKVAFPYNHQESLQFEQINRWGTLNIVRTLLEHPSVKRFVYISSAAVYGFGEQLLYSKEANPSNPYGFSKYHGEQYVKLLKDHCDTVIIRSGNVFGFNPCMRMDGVINNFIFNALTQGKIHLFGNGEQKRGFVSLELLIQQIEERSINGSESEIVNCIEFNANLNQVKDWILDKLDTEYVRVNQHQQMPGQSFAQVLHQENAESLIHDTIEVFQRYLGGQEPELEV